MKISIITVCYNSASTIKDTIDSVLQQTYREIEYIIVDGASTDSTLNIVRSYGDLISKIISEPDSGIYNAMNKGIKHATGDVVGIVNSDDFLNNSNIIQRVADEFISNDLDALYGDIQYVRPEKLNEVVRYYSSKSFSPNKFKYGFMPAHPSFYVKRHLFEKYGFYKENYIIAADFELLLRFMYGNNIRIKYIQMPFVTMRTGGISNKSLKSNYILNSEILRACRENNIKTNLVFIYSKYILKFFELFNNN